LGVVQAAEIGGLLSGAELAALTRRLDIKPTKADRDAWERHVDAWIASQR
jgi:hypothetical protein